MTAPHTPPTGLLVFSDFDGTIATRDVGNRLFHHFSHGKSNEPVTRWRAGEIDSKQCLHDESLLIDDLTHEELFDFVDEFTIDPGFPPFVEFCRANNISVHVLSDGLDIYIKRLLANNGLADLPVLTNVARLKNGRLHITWPYYDHTCGECGNCKGYHIRRLRQSGQTALYIGDGQSDVCAVGEADMIFAKDFLADYCRRNRIEYLPFDSFYTITQVVAETFNLEHVNRS
jgi:2-hydroxy-3-keto-5-methylthiopentenyl-1-phosphate phosphatase